MAKAYSINYDLKAPGRDYSGLYEAIKKYTWWHYLESTWLIVTNDNVQSVWDKLSPHVDKNDNMLIIEVGKDRQGWLPEKAWEWIKQNLQN
jgi:hypothetical protein